MILILEPDTDRKSPAYEALLAQLDALPNIEHRAHTVQGAQQTLTELYLLGNTQALSTRDMAELPLVERVVRVAEQHAQGQHHARHRVRLVVPRVDKRQRPLVVARLLQ